MPGSSVDTATRQAVEDFMYMEARLLDDWRLDEWFELLTEDCSYEVPATDAPNGSPTTTLGLVADDYERLRQRVGQLMGRSMWCENPRSRTRRIVGNVYPTLSDEGTEDVLDVSANFIIHRFDNNRSDVFVGRYQNVLVRTADSFNIRRRRVLLDHPTLLAQGKLSIIL